MTLRSTPAPCAVQPFIGSTGRSAPGRIWPLRRKARAQAPGLKPRGADPWAPTGQPKGRLTNDAAMSCLLRGFVLLLSSSPSPRGHPLSARLEATLWPSASCPPTDARAARMVKFEREQLIVDCLDCGVSACWSLLREAPRRVALQPEGGEVRPAASAGEARAEIPRSPPSARTPPPSPDDSGVAWSPSPALTRGGGKGGDASPPPWSECGMGEGDRPKDGGGGRAATGLGVARARKSRRKPLKRLNPRPGIRRAFRPPRPLVPTSRSRFGPPPRQATRARKSRRKPLKRLKSAPRPGIRRALTTCETLVPTTRFRFGPPPRQATRARKSRRKALKRLNPRPGIRRAFRPPRPLVPTTRFRFGPPPRQATRARKSRRKPLKRLNPRPGIRRALRPPRPLVPTSRSRFGPPPRQATRARKSRRKALKRLNPRPGKGQPAEAAARPAANCRRLTPARARSRSPSGPSSPSAGRRAGRCSGRDRRRRRRRRGSRGCGRSA